MPVNKKIKILEKDSVRNIILASLFVFAYFLILIYTYNSLTQTAQTDIAKATSNAAISLSRIIEADSAQVDIISGEISSKASEIGALDSKSLKEMGKYLASIKPENSVGLAYFYADSTYITSDGVVGEATDMDHFNSSKATRYAFTYNIPNMDDKDHIHYFRPIKSEGSIIGYLTVTYDYRDTLADCYSTPADIKQLTDIIFSEDGTIILRAGSKNSQFADVTNLFAFLKRNMYDGTLPISEKEAGTNTFISSSYKFVVATSPIEGNEGLFIAHIMPSSAMYADTGKLILFMILATFLFFFVLVVIAYRYYKNITETSNRIKTVAFTDPLTGFANFAKFKEDTEKLLFENPDKKRFIGCLDLVGFRYINDAFGYDAGDEILIQVTHEINDLLDEEDELFARLSGDKFVILTSRDFSDTDHEMFINQLADRISSIGPLAKSHIRLEVQMGFYEIKPEDINELSVNALYDRCLMALLTIEHTDSGVAVYDEAIYNEQLERKDIESRMHQALKDGEFRVYVQPKYKTNNGKLAAGEALIRWIDPNKGIVPPIKFIPLFEQNRFVHEVDLYVMEVVSRFQRSRLNEGLPVVPISLNISPVEITMPGFRDSYISIKDKYDIPDKLIELEFTEGIFFDNETLFKDVITDFHNHGFTCSMDDFGSGYSSLNILKDLPVDTLKLDKLFFRESNDTARDRSIIRSVVAMARSLNIKTVAEGVETLDVVNFLKLIGCTLIQGYIYSKPLPLTEFEEKLNTENIDTDDNIELDFDKFEVVPLDMPITNNIDDSLRRTYAAILEINASGNLYHIYYPSDSDIIFDAIPERGFYSSLCTDIIPKYVHPKDLEKVQNAVNPMNLKNHFKKNNELDLEYRHIRKDGSYSWMKFHIIKATGGRSDSQIFFGYFNVIDTYKETEESLNAIQNRFTAAYSNFNGVVFELDINTGWCDILETHSNLLGAVRDVHDYNQLYGFIYELLLHPDYRNVLESSCTLEYLRTYFTNSANQPSHYVEIQAKPSRKANRYDFYRATFSAQADPNKILLTVEDITEAKKKEYSTELKNKITDSAFANTFERISTINLDKDVFTTATYPANGHRKPVITEGKYSVHWSNSLKTFLKPEDCDNISQITSLEGLIAFYEDNTTSEFKAIFRERASENTDYYEWKESLIVSAPHEFGQDRLIYVFIKNIDDARCTEKNLNEFAHRLSYSLAMFDYSYSVDCKTEKVEILGGLKFESDIFGNEDISYQDVTTMVKNSVIAEEDQAAFRRLSYLDELLENFKSHQANLVKTFRSLESNQSIVEVTIIYGAREEKLTFFIRQLDKNNYNIDS